MPRARLGSLLQRLLLLVVFTGGLVGVAAGTAQAHAMLESSTPAQGALLTSAPAHVALHFDEPVALSSDSLRILDSAGKAVQVGAAEHPAQQGSDVTVGLQPRLADGTYLVVWHVVSSDSHPVAGTFTFSVGHASAAAHVTATPTDRVTSVAMSTARGAGYLGLAVGTGGVWFGLLCLPGGQRSRRSDRLTVLGFCLALLGTVGLFVLQGPYGADRSPGAVLDGHLLAQTLHTRFGAALLVRCALLPLVALAGGWALRLRRRATLVSYTLLAEVMFGTFAYSGHASDGSQVAVAIGSDLVHVTAMSLWLGGLAQLAALAVRGEDNRPARTAVDRFSGIALLSVVALIGSGIYQAWRQAGILGDLLGTYYGRLLLVKVALVLAALGGAYFSRRWVHRGRVASGGETAALPLHHLRLTVGVEIGLVVLALGVTSVLVAAPPAREAYLPSSHYTVADGPLTLEVTVHPQAGRTVDLELRTVTDSGQPAQLQQLGMSLSMSSRSVGPIAVTTPAASGSTFSAQDVQLPYAGTWSLLVQARTTAIDEYDTTVQIPIR